MWCPRGAQGGAHGGAQGGAHGGAQGGAHGGARDMVPTDCASVPHAMIFNKNNPGHHAVGTTSGTTSGTTLGITSGTILGTLPGHHGLAERHEGSPKDALN